MKSAHAPTLSPDLRVPGKRDHVRLFPWNLTRVSMPLPPRLRLSPSSVPSPLPPCWFRLAILASDGIDVHRGRILSGGGPTLPDADTTDFPSESPAALSLTGDEPAPLLQHPGANERPVEEDVGITRRTGGISPAAAVAPSTTSAGTQASAGAEAARRSPSAVEVPIITQSVSAASRLAEERPFANATPQSNSALTKSSAYKADAIPPISTHQQSLGGASSSRGTVFMGRGFVAAESPKDTSPPMPPALPRRAKSVERRRGGSYAALAVGTTLRPELLAGTAGVLTATAMAAPAATVAAEGNPDGRPVPRRRAISAERRGGSSDNSIHSDFIPPAWAAQSRSLVIQQQQGMGLPRPSLQHPLTMQPQAPPAAATHATPTSEGRMPAAGGDRETTSPTACEQAAGGEQYSAARQTVATAVVPPGMKANEAQVGFGRAKWVGLGRREGKGKGERGREKVEQTPRKSSRFSLAHASPCSFVPPAHPTFCRSDRARRRVSFRCARVRLHLYRRHRNRPQAPLTTTMRTAAPAARAAPQRRVRERADVTGPCHPTSGARAKTPRATTKAVVVAASACVTVAL